MKHHELKIWPMHYNDIIGNCKTFELRKNDRDFQIGDTVQLREYDPKVELYTGRDFNFEIGYLLKSGDVEGLQDGFCIIALP